MELTLVNLFFELAAAIQKDSKLGYLLLAFLFGIPSFVIYLRAEVIGSTKPHPVTFLIWFITMVIATAGMEAGNGGYGVVYSVFYCLCLLCIFLVTVIKYGIKEVSRKDVVCFFICLCAIFVWVVFSSLLMSVLIATAVDAYGYEPTYRKSYKEPWAESMVAWSLSIPNNIFIVLAMEEYNLLTMTSLVVMLACSTALIILCLWRRRIVPRPSLEALS